MANEYLPKSALNLANFVRWTRQRDALSYLLACNVKKKMKKIIPDSPEDRKNLLLATTLNPEAIVWLGVLLFGVAAAGWFIIGVGVLLALLPVLGLFAYWFSRRKKGMAMICPNLQSQRTSYSDVEQHRWREI